ncbi:MAG: PHP domain-containing protein [Chloroflexi bacterium]|nr:PHP domain-containing protein [Chloroflexota bacterium]
MPNDDPDARSSGARHIPYAELHCHTNHSFLDGASMAEDLVRRAAELGLTALAATDTDGLYGVVRLTKAAQAAGLHPVLGTEIELGDPAVADPDAVVLPPRRPRRRPRGTPERPPAAEGSPSRPRPGRARLPGYRAVVREDLRGVGARARGPRLVLLARNKTGWSSLTRLLSTGNMTGSKGAPRFDHALLERHHVGVVALSGGRNGEIGRRLLVGDRAGARAAAERLAGILGPDGLVIELTHHLLPDDDWLIAESVALARDLRLPVVVTNAVRYAHPWGRELQDVLTAIRHGRTLDTLADLRRPSGEAYLKSGAELAALGASLEPTVARAWREGIEYSVELAAACTADLDFEQSRFPGFQPPDDLSPDEYLRQLCWKGLHDRYPVDTEDGRKLFTKAEERLERELTTITAKNLEEFFLICWDVMRFAREQRIPAHGRGSAAGSIVTYVLYISRVEPIRHDLLFERFISDHGTVFPDVDIDFSSERREEVIQYIYAKYGPEHTGMVCNLITYRARSAVRDVGNALGFPRPLVDRVAKALETYDPVRVRDDLQADGGFGDLFRASDGSGESGPAPQARVPPPDRASLVGDKGGPGDSPTSIALLQGGSIPGHRSGSSAGIARRSSVAIPHSETGNPLAPPRRVDHAVQPGEGMAPIAVRPMLERTGRASSDEWASDEGTDQRRGGSTIGLSPWERWLELAARLDSFPRHLSIHSGGMLITGRPLVDIVPIERATMPGRVVVQFDKRDVEALKLIKLDLLGLGMLGAIDKTLRLIERDCGEWPDLDTLPEDIPEVFEMIGAADTVGVFQIESRAQMQTLPKSRPTKLDDLVVAVAIIRPGPIQGDAVHPYLRRRQGLEKETYVHEDLRPILEDSLGVILYQEQVMRISMRIAGFSGARSDQFRRAMGAWRVTGDMDEFHHEFVQGAIDHGLEHDQAEDLFRRCAAFANFGFAKSHAAAFARTAYESAFLKLFYPAQTLVGLIDSQPMGFYPTEVLVNDTKHHGVAVLPVDINTSGYRTTTEWVGEEGQPAPIVSSAIVVPSAEARHQWALPGATGWGVRLGLHLVKGIGEQHEEALDRERERGPYRSLVDVVERTDLSEEVVERLIRAGALDSLGRPRRELLWQLREVAGRSGRPARVAGRRRARSAGSADGATPPERATPPGGATAAGSATQRGSAAPTERAAPPGTAASADGAAAPERAAFRQLDLRLPPTEAPPLPTITDAERLGDAYAILGVDPERHAVSLFRPALEQLGAVTNAALADLPIGRVRVGGLVVTRQHPMTARGTVFLALEDETGMVNVTLWPATWARLRPVVRRHALLLVDGELQRDGGVVNLVAHAVQPLPEVAGVRQMGFAGMRRLG